MEDTAKHCDFDRDGDCDEKDFQFFKQTLGSCEGDPNYHPLADDDGSGCIDSVDQHYLFPNFSSRGDE